MGRGWMLLVAAPAVLAVAALVLNVAFPECGYSGVPPCGDVHLWRDVTVLLAFYAGGALLLAVALRAVLQPTRQRPRPWMVAMFAVPWAYVAGWVADAILNDDPCIGVGFFGDETGAQPKVLHEKWPVRTNCRVPGPDGLTFERGDASVFVGVFGFWIAGAIIVVRPLRWWLRLVLGVVAFAGMVAVIFL